MLNLLFFAILVPHFVSLVTVGAGGDTAPCLRNVKKTITHFPLHFHCKDHK
jgi:hypothetical protein